MTLERQPAPVVKLKGTSSLEGWDKSIHPSKTQPFSRLPNISKRDYITLKLFYLSINKHNVYITNCFPFFQVLKILILFRFNLRDNLFVFIKTLNLKEIFILGLFSDQKLEKEIRNLFLCLSPFPYYYFVVAVSFPLSPLPYHLILIAFLA